MQVLKHPSILKVTSPGINSIMHFDAFERKSIHEKTSENPARFRESNRGTDKTKRMILLLLGKCALLSNDGVAFR